MSNVRGPSRSSAQYAAGHPRLGLGYQATSPRRECGDLPAAQGDRTRPVYGERCLGAAGGGPIPPRDRARACCTYDESTDLLELRVAQIKSSARASSEANEAPDVPRKRACRRVATDGCGSLGGSVMERRAGSRSTSRSGSRGEADVDPRLEVRLQVAPRLQQVVVTGDDALRDRPPGERCPRVDAEADRDTQIIELQRAGERQALLYGSPGPPRRVFLGFSEAQSAPISASRRTERCS